jgi:hypothetical protein
VAFSQNQNQRGRLLRGFFVFFFSGRQIDGVAANHVSPLRLRICFEGYAGGRALPIRQPARRIGNLPLLSFDRELRLFYQPLYDRLSAIDLRGAAQPTHFVGASANWMPHPWRFHGWAAVPMGSADFADSKLGFASLVVIRGASNDFNVPLTLLDCGRI